MLLVLLPLRRMRETRRIGIWAFSFPPFDSLLILIMKMHFNRVLLQLRTYCVVVRRTNNYSTLNTVEKYSILVLKNIVFKIE